MRTYSQSNVEVLEGLDQSGALDILVKRAVIPSNIKTYMLMYREVKKQITESGTKKMQAYQNVAELFRVSETTIREAVRWCES